MHFIVFFFLGDSPVSELCVSMFWNIDCSISNGWCKQEE